MSKKKKDQDPIILESKQPAEIHLYLNEDGTVSSEVKNLNFNLMLQMVVPFLVQKSRAVYEVAATQKSPQVPALTAAQLEDLKLTMYDTLNIAFSNALDAFAPEIEARPSLSADAIYRAQQELLKEDMKARGYDPETGEKLK